METNIPTQTLNLADLTGSETTFREGKPWYIVRPELLITLAFLIAVLGLIIAWPMLVDHTLMAVL